MSGCERQLVFRSKRHRPGEALSIKASGTRRRQKRKGGRRGVSRRSPWQSGRSAPLAQCSLVLHMRIERKVDAGGGEGRTWREIRVAKDIQRILILWPERRTGMLFQKEGLQSRDYREQTDEEASRLRFL